MIKIFGSLEEKKSKNVATVESNQENATKTQKENHKKIVFDEDF